jgi:hypothetical protein
MWRPSRKGLSGQRLLKRYFFSLQLNTRVF